MQRRDCWAKESPKKDLKMISREDFKKRAERKKNLISPPSKNSSMIVKFRNVILISLFLFFSVLIAGCTDQSGTPAVPTPAVYHANYTAGDIIAKTAASSEKSLYVIIKYDSSTDQYTRQLIYKNTDGTWGHFASNATEKVERTLVEKLYPVKIAHVTLSGIPVATLTVLPTVTTYSGNAPVISGISPSTGGSDATVGVTITGTNFQSGATAKLLRGGSAVIYATSVSVSSSTTIECTFKFSKAEKGTYNVIITNPDGQSSTLAGAFIVGDSPPAISSVSPSQAAINDTVSLTINGQNFKDGVRVTLVKSSTEIVCNSPVSTATTKILCDLNLETSSSSLAGDWDVVVLNIDGQKKATWSQKFRITNST